ncbi:MAG TPA: putative aminohydrolase SsnA [Anaerolineales bacterium]|jgi:putative selenium metabolism protein SsnA|nr:putative aminohydrolase SsnA [Anaerolineales bacterium]HQX16410.1 putative aminohydrolase SsnA [Anaerolineales bacterium]
MLIINAKLVTWEKENRILDDHAILIENDRIKEIGKSADLLKKYPHEEKLDARGQYVMPGNICAHTHFYGAFSRGMAIPGPAPKDFPEILQKLWWPLDRSLDAESIQYSALPCLVDAIRHGTTTLIDHHASPNAIDGSLDILGDAVEQSGLRAVLCYEVTDRDGEEKMKAGLRENVRFIKKTKSPLLAATFGLHASLTLSDASLDLCRQAIPNGFGFHVHTAEHESDEYDSLNKSNMRVIDRLQKHNILGPNTITAHGVHFDAREMEILADTGTWLTHQPRSNMNNGVGVAQIESMLRAGIKVCLGNDGFSNAMWEEWKAAYLLHKVHHRDPRRMGGYDVQQMAIYNNAALALVFFKSATIGQLSAGAFADIIFVDYHPNTPLTAGNLPWHIIFGFQQSMVTTTIVAGKILMKDRELLTLDENEISAKAREIAPKVWERYQKEVAKII